MRVLTVVGARPQFIKAAPVSRALRQRHTEVLLHTGQHYDDALSASFFRDLGIPDPDVHLSADGGPTEQRVGARLARMIRGIREHCAAAEPDVVMVYGDTDSTLAGALAASASRRPLVHVEAGLRSHNLRMPEEINRIAADHLSALLLCPTESAAATLRREGASGALEVVGDVMLDACLQVAETGKRLGIAERLGVEPGRYYAATLHRAENTDDGGRLRSIVRALDALDVPVLLPCHPRTRAALVREGLLDGLSGLRVVEPLRYPEMLGLVADARALLTDSGGLQKEAYFLAIPCVTLRDETEWTETVESGWNRLAGASTERIREAVAAAAAPRDAPDLEAYGAGCASTAVVEAIEAHLE